jgi:hypothetical protein
MIGEVLGVDVDSDAGWSQTVADCKPNLLNIPEAKYPWRYPVSRATFRPVAGFHYFGANPPTMIFLGSGRKGIADAPRMIFGRTEVLP